MRSARIVSLALLALPGGAWAQDEQPLPPGHPPIGDMALPAEDEGEPVGDTDDHGDDSGEAPASNPHMAMGRRMGGTGGRETLDANVADPELPRGTIVVRVVDPEGQPVADAHVELGSLVRGNSERKVGRTGPGGEVRWDDLAMGGQRAYRITVTNGPARYPAAPFQLTGSSGRRVTITQWPVTESTQNLLLFVMRTFLEFAEEGNRLKVTQHLQLMNIGQSAIAPDEGVPLPVPPGMKAFRAEDSMGDQRVAERDGKLWIEGSIPPGEVQLAYGFDLDLKGSDYDYVQRIPFQIVLAEVYVEKAPGMTFNAPNMRGPEEIDMQGRTFVTARVTRRPQSPSFSKLRIELGNLPSPGAGRWIALGIGVILMGLGLGSLLSGGDRRAAERAALAAEKERLLAEAERIEAQHRKGKLAPSLYERVRDRNLTRLAEVLRMEDRG